VVGHSGKHGAFLCLRETGLVAPTAWQITFSGRAGLPLFDGAMVCVCVCVCVALPWEGSVVSTGPLCSVQREASWHQQNSKAWNLGFTVCMVAGSWH
jgi:hypothetical protein